MRVIETELKPCPFCGGSAFLWVERKCLGHGDYYNSYKIMCKECGASAKPVDDYNGKVNISECERAWNNRIIGG